MRCHFILVNPARAENVGFAARALKTMGFSSLRIVGEPLTELKSARKTAYGAHDILNNTSIHSALPLALEDIGLAIGTTSKRRIKRYDYHTPEQICVLLQNKGDALNDVAMVFGSEENGLSTSELEQCNLVSTIPLAGSYPSLNLAQSVLIYAWELSKVEIQLTKEDAGNPKLQGLLKDEVISMLNLIGITEKPLLHQRFLDRLMLLNSEDMALLMTVLTKLKRNQEN